MRSYVLAFAAFSLSAPAQAEWYRASSEHFLIYADQRPATIQRFAENLEKFDGAVRAVRGMDDLPLSQGNKVTIFVLRSPEEVQRLVHDQSGLVQGYYEGRVEGSVAFVPPLTISGKDRAAVTGSHFVDKSMPAMEMGGDVVLLHEYSHHLMMQDLNSPYPEWFVEGFAEFMSTARFEGDGSVGLGLPAGHRAAGLMNGGGLSLEKLLAGRYDKLTDEETESIYGKGWLLAHYLTFDSSRKGQLTAYLVALAKGVDPLDAARQAFGNLGKLDDDLNTYLRRAALPYLKVSGAAVSFAPVQVTQLSRGGAAVLPLLAELKSRIAANQTESLVASIRTIEARFPGDELVEATLAEAELDAGHAEAAEAASDRAIKANPRNAGALVLKGRAIALRASKTEGATRHSLFDQAQKTFIAANKIDAEAPHALYEFYKAFVDEGIRPTPNAIAALHYASVLAPQDLGLRMTSALSYLSEGKAKDARRELIPVAYYPHGGSISEVARKILGHLATGDLKGALTAAGAGAD